MKITVYITSYNYGKYLKEAVDSVLKQTLKDWELIIINDGSTDNTAEVIEQYKNHPQIITIDQENKGLSVSNNIALRLSRGRYIMRLDGDDYLDENALLILSNILDTKEEIGLVYPDYYEIDPNGEILNLVRRKKIGEEVELLDLPAHGACTMFRKECLLEIGGYSEAYSCQDGYDIWLRFINKFKPYNVNNALFYYRQHPLSLTKKKNKILETRGKIKEDYVKYNHKDKILNIMGIIPVTSNSVHHFSNPFQILAGKPLIWYTIKETEKARLDRLILATDDDKVIEYTQNNSSKIKTIKRPPHLSSSSTRMADIVSFVINKVKEVEKYEPDVVCTLYINTPLRKAVHINNAIDTMKIFDVDSVVSVEEELAFCHHHTKYGLESIQKNREIRTEKQAIYKENGAIYLSKTWVFFDRLLTGEKIGHIIMLPEESVKINTEFDLWLAEKIILEWDHQK